MTCDYIKLQQSGQAYPRTCPECGLGPCKYRTMTAAIKDAGDDVVEPEPTMLAAMRLVGNAPEVIKYIDTLLSAYKRVCVERDEAREAAQTWAKSHNMQMERAEKAEAERDEFRKDAERYVEWRSAFRNGECALYNALCDAQTDSEHDAAIDSARNK